MYLAPPVDITCLVVQVRREGLALLFDDIPCLTACKIVLSEPIFNFLLTILRHEIATNTVATFQLCISQRHTDGFVSGIQATYNAIVRTKRKCNTAQQPGYLNL